MNTVEFYKKIHGDGEFENTGHGYLIPKWFEYMALDIAGVHSRKRRIVKKVVRKVLNDILKRTLEMVRNENCKRVCNKL